MKIPIVRSEVGVSAAYPAGGGGRGIPAAAFESGAGVAALELARGAEDVSRIVERTARLREQQEQQDAQAEAIFLQSQYELGLQQHDAQAKQTLTNGQDYLEQRRQVMQETAQTVLAQARNPRTPKLLQAHLAGVVVRLDEQALQHAAALTKQSAVAQLENTVENFRQQLGGMDWQDTENIARVQGLIDAAIATQAPRIGEDEATKRIIAERHKTGYEIALRHQQAAPDSFVTGLDRYRGVVDPTQLDHLAQGAFSRIEQLKRQQQVDERMAQDRLDREIAKQRTDTYARLGDSIRFATGPRVTPDQLRADPGWQWLEEGQREHLYKMVTDPVASPSDPATRTYVISHLRNGPGDLPTIGNAEIYRLNQTRGPGGRPLLNDEDTLAFTGIVTSRRDEARSIGRAEQHRAEDQGKSDVERRHRDVHELAIRVLGAPMLAAEKLDDQSRMYQGAFLEQMMRRSSGAGRPQPGFPRNETPEAVYQDVLPPLVKGLRGDVEAAYGKLQQKAAKMGLTPEAFFRKYPGDPSQYAGSKEYQAAYELFKDMDIAKKKWDELDTQLKRLGVTAVTR